MLKPLITRIDEVNKYIAEHMYDTDLMYYQGCPHPMNLLDPKDITAGNNRYDYISVDSKDNICGYISFHIQYDTHRAERFGMFSMHQNPIVFARDIEEAIDICFNVHNVDVIDWRCVEGNPVKKSYDALSKRFGGGQTGIIYNISKMPDCSVRNIICYTLFREEYNKIMWEKCKKKK